VEMSGVLQVKLYKLLPRQDILFLITVHFKLFVFLDKVIQKNQLDATIIY